MKARPTEYKGIRFRSKSEAVFARYLDLTLDELAETGTAANVASGSRGGFRYEPKTHIDGWNPDFLMWQVDLPHERFEGGNFFSSIPRLNETYIEYKPSRPTDTYVNEWFDYVSKWKDVARNNSPERWWRSDFRIYYGSVFSSADRGVLQTNPVGEIFDDKQNDWVAGLEDELKSYRFDLQQQAVT